MESKLKLVPTEIPCKGCYYYTQSGAVCPTRDDESYPCYEGIDKLYIWVEEKKGEESGK